MDLVGLAKMALTLAMLSGLAWAALHALVSGDDR